MLCYERDFNQKCFYRFDVIEKRNRNLLRRLLDRNLDEKASPNSAEFKAKTFYHSCVKKTEELEQVNRLDLVDLIQVCLQDSNPNPFLLSAKKARAYHFFLLLLLGTFTFLRLLPTPTSISEHQIPFWYSWTLLRVL